MYESIHDLPIVCQLNLPEPALRLYRDAFNRAWRRARSDEKSRYRFAQERAWSEVRKHFVRDPLGRWTPRENGGAPAGGRRSISEQSAQQKP